MKTTEKKNPWYEVNEKDKVVTCIIRTKNGEAVGVARCSDSDEFDVEKGKRIALIKGMIQVRENERQLIQNTKDFLELTDRLSKNLKHKLIQHAIQEANDMIRINRKETKKLLNELKEF